MSEGDIPEGDYKHGEIVIFHHKFTKGDMNHPRDDDITEIDCDGIVTWESVLEGLVCSKCQLYTGVK